MNKLTKSDWKTNRKCPTIPSRYQQEDKTNSPGFAEIILIGVTIFAVIMFILCVFKLLPICP